MSDPAQRILDECHAARAAWPGVEVLAADFERYVRERDIEAADPPASAPAHFHDLYLACACALGDARALQTFDRVFLAQVPRFIARLSSSASLVDEVRQILRERLLVRTADAAPQITSYKGHGPLVAWLRVVAYHIATQVLAESGGRAEVELADDSMLADRVANQELELIKAEHRQEFEQAVRAALGSLSRRDRNMLRLHLVAGISTRKLAAMFHLSQSSLVRSLAGTRQTISDAVHTRLRERLGLDVGELHSLTGLLLSRLDLSLAACLRSDQS